MNREKTKEKGAPAEKPNFYEMIRRAVDPELEMLEAYLSEARDAKDTDKIVQFANAVAAIKAQTIVAAAQAQAVMTGALLGSRGQRAIKQTVEDEKKAAQDLAGIRAKMLADKAAGRR